MELIMTGFFWGLILMFYIMDKKKGELERKHRQERTADFERNTAVREQIANEIKATAKSRLLMDDDDYHYGGAIFSLTETVEALSNKYGWDTNTLKELVEEVFEEDEEKDCVLERYQNFYFIKFLYEDLKWSEERLLYDGSVGGWQLVMPIEERKNYLNMLKNGLRPNF